MRRNIQPEILDELARRRPARHSVAARSAEGQRVHGTPGDGRARACARRRRPRAFVVELGAGDGTFLLRVAKRLGRQTGMRALLVDRRPSLSAATRNGFEAAGWDDRHLRVRCVRVAVRAPHRTADATVANLFLHHFREGELAHLLNLARRQTNTLHRVRAAAIAHRARRRVAAAPARLQRCHHARRRRQRARGLPRSRVVGALAARRRMAAQRAAGGTLLA